MEKVKLVDLAQMAEIIAAVGVIITLTYVALELSENTAAVRAGTSQAIFDSSREFVLDVALSEDLSRIRSVGSLDFEDLSLEEAARFRALVLGNWIYFQNVWIQWTLGVVDERVWGTYLRMFCGQLRGPGTVKVWKQQQRAFDQDFVTFVSESCPGT